MRQPVVLATWLVASVALPVAAQLTEVQPGVRVRVEAPGIVAGKFEGTVLTRAADTIVVGAPNSVPIRLPIARLSGLEISRGTSRAAGAIRGMQWGVPIMTAFGALMSVAAVNSDCRGCTPISTGDAVGWTALSALSGAIYGAGIGALVGRERWERFDLSPRTSLNVRQGRLGLGLSLSF